MTPEERAAKLARAICACTCYAPRRGNADNSGPLKDGSHFTNCPSENEAEVAADLAAAIRDAETAAMKAEREACADIAAERAADAKRHTMYPAFCLNERVDCSEYLANRIRERTP